MKSFKKMWLSSLSFLEHNVVYSIIVFVVVIYILGLFDGINSFIGGLYNYLIIRLVVILLIIWVAPKDPSLAILLGLSYAVSLQYMTTSENFIAPVEESNVLNQVMSQQKHLNDTILMNRNNVATKEQFMSEENNNVNKIKKNNQEEHFFPVLNTNKEHFFPVLKNNSNNNNNSFDIRRGSETKQKKVSNSNNTVNSESSSSCLDMYVPQYETVGNICNPVATFEGELNAQGLNTDSPDGFDSSSFGSPLN